MSNSNIGLNGLISWKGQTFNQITSSIRKNGAVNSAISLGMNILNRGGLPLKIYRREIAVPSDTSCHQRTSMRIDLLNAPGGSITNSSVNNGNTGGLVNIVDFNLTSNSSERPGSACDSQCASVGNIQTNSLRRLRSGGMVKRQFDLSTNKRTYYTNSQQYINSRNRGFEQNQYYYTRSGNSSAKPGDSLTTNNIYSTNTLTDCKQVYVSAATTFTYTWVNQPTIVSGNNTTPPATATVTIPVGYYTMDGINTILHNTMIENLHYYTALNSKAKVFLINFAFNESTQKVELTISPISAAIVAANNYGKALQVTAMGVVETTDWNTPTVTATPQVTISNNAFANIIGFAAATYPATNTNTTETTFVSSTTTLLQPAGNRVYYKPNNPQFAQQGAVTAGSKIARKKYDTITNTASSYRTAFGLHVANALAYGVPANGYTIKDKLGYPNKSTPVVTATGEMRFCK
jgi:hypothetical protein